MALNVTYQNIGLYAAAQIATINTRHAATKLDLYLRPARTAILAKHFPANWLKKIKVCVVGDLPGAQLKQLAEDMAFPGTNPEKSFKIECFKVNSDLYNAIKMFAYPIDPSIGGITYDNVIYLKPKFQHNLQTIVHELVHSLQWNKYGPAEFLARYIKGFVKVKLNYPLNPAEQKPYMLDANFVKQAGHQGLNLKGRNPLLYNDMAKMKPSIQGLKAINDLQKIPPMKITEAVAIGTMPSIDIKKNN